MEELEIWIMNELPIEGQWWSDGYNTFIESAEKCYFLGMGLGEIKDMLKKLYSAVANEFI